MKTANVRIRPIASTDNYPCFLRQNAHTTSFHVQPLIRLLPPVPRLRRLRLWRHPECEEVALLEPTEEDAQAAARVVRMTRFIEGEALDVPESDVTFTASAPYVLPLPTSRGSRRVCWTAS